ncbi:MAG TPA: ACP S-malonyltransferase [Candidatus Omnitrophota bacterium]|nr:ACP S-malonyltransferase [Candidatus Omnitrophota bacterium]HPN55638.1 ACP S-malonyltransferase [Candidatus Omnitrophota bacterium]
MSKVAFIFPGQGAQYVGMGKSLYEHSSEAKAVFDQADEILGKNLKDIIFEGPVETLTSTAYCQPAILTTSFAAYKALSGRGIQPAFLAGLSLGELTAVAVSGALSFEDTLKLVERRAAFMEEATRLNDGKMAAVIGLDKETIIGICQKAGAEVANFNSPQQIVITGHAEKVADACCLLKAAGAKNVVPLEVSGAFHSSLMRAAEEKFKQELERYAFKDTEVPLVSNVNAKPATQAEVVRGNLSRQITSSVQWVDSINFMEREGVINFVEIGPGKVLKGLLRKINAQFQVINVDKFEDIEAVNF